MDGVEIGVVTSAVGLKGEMRIKSYAQDPERFRKVRELTFVKNGKRTTCRVLRARVSGGMAVVQAEGIETRDDSEKMRGAEVFMNEDELEELPEGEYYIRDLIGMEAVDASGRVLGTVKDVLTDRPQDLYVIGKADGGELLVPSVDEFIKEIDPAGRRITVELIEGME